MIDYHFVFAGNYYSVPYQYIHKDVQIRATSKTVECFYQEQRIAAHIRSYILHGYTTINEHMPHAHRAHSEWSPERLGRWAKKIGPDTAKFIDGMMVSRPFPEQAFRACLGILRMAKRFGEERLEKACAIGLSVGANRYRQIESILKKRLDTVAPNSRVESEPVISEHENIRGSLYYK